jgi:hypothetical protein
MHLFVLEWDGKLYGDYVIATDWLDAFRVLEETGGDYSDRTDLEARQWPDDEVFPIVEVDEPGKPVETRTAGQIVADCGRGYHGGWA